jgi:hypothetical protein
MGAPVNNPPTAVDDTVGLDEDSGSRLVDVLANDTTDQGESLVIVSFGAAAHGTVGPGGESAQLLYTPNADFCGPDSFDYTISDGSLTAVGTVTVNVACVNDLPRPQPDFFAVAEDSVDNVLDVLANDADVDQSPFFVLGCFPEAVDNLHGTVTIAANGAHVLYTPEPNFFGIASFICKVTDGSGPGIDQPGALVTVSVANVNDPPTAVDDTFTVNEDSFESFVPVLANDLITPDRAEFLQVLATTSAQHGLVVVGGDGRQVIYKPNANFCGADSFGYTISDGHGGTDTATATITVTCVNDAPQPLDDVVTIPEDSGDVVIDVLKNDGNVDGASDPLRVDGCYLDIGRGDNPHGSFRVAADGSHVIYRPDANFFGTAAFSCIIGDSLHGGANAPLSRVAITVTSVNDPPTAGDDTVSIGEDSGPSLVDVLANDTTAPDQGETLVLVSFGAAAHGTVGVGGESAQLLYTPNADFCGQDSFNYTISDRTLTDVGTVIVNVACVNDLPRPQPDSFVVAEDSVENVLDVLRNDVDVDGTPFFVLGCFTEGVDNRHGTVTVAPNGTHVIYTPDPNFSGTASFVCKVTEGFGPGADQPGALVTVNVTPVNDVPLAGDDNYTLERRTNTALSVGTPGILGNDFDADNPTITAVQVSGPANGSLMLNADGSFTYTPNPSFVGSDSFTYRAFDGASSSEVATVSIAVNWANTAPVAGDDTFETNANTAITGNVLGNDKDVDNDTLTATLVSAPLAGLTFNADGSFTYMPAAGIAGPVTFSYKASDGHLESNIATVTITVKVDPNRQPWLDELYDDWWYEGDAIWIRVNAGDPDRDPLTFSAQGLPPGIEINPQTGEIFGQFQRLASVGIHKITITVSDGRLSASQTATWTIREKNQAPWMPRPKNQNNYEHDTVSFELAGADPDWDPVTFTATGLPPGVVVNPDGTVRGHLPLGSAGMYTVTVKISDGRKSASATFKWTVREQKR